MNEMNMNWLKKYLFKEKKKKKKEGKGKMVMIVIVMRMTRQRRGGRERGMYIQLK